MICIILTATKPTKRRIANNFILQLMFQQDRKVAAQSHVYNFPTSNKITVD